MEVKKVGTVRTTVYDVDGVTYFIIEANSGNFMALRTHEDGITLTVVQENEIEPLLDAINNFESKQ